ncbi:unnamed protein product [Paramecium octaurelia]|uniref:Uncharacterized protein n=1 Tax=Paramecium octaurelia TaxID=43137 RepID=A0A8S1W1A0_PAROT|nr:unnamed protein product [Paramecium octaurelia]
MHSASYQVPQQGCAEISNLTMKSVGIKQNLPKSILGGIV